MRKLPIKKFPGYSVSDDGFIHSEPRRVLTTGRSAFAHLKKVTARILKGHPTGQGYLHVTLRKDNAPFSVRVHIVVAEAFIGPRPRGMVVHHKDNNKLNNAADNLEYTTRQGNTQAYYRAIGKRRGTIPINHLHAIHARVASGESLYKIAKEYNVTRNDIATITRVVALTGNELEFKER